IAFLLPPPQEDLGPPLPNPAQHNKDLKLYGEAIAKVAEKRGAQVVDLYKLLDPKVIGNQGPTTDNGLHLTAYGYWRAAPRLEQGLGLDARNWQVVVSPQQGNISARGTRASRAKVSPTQVQFTLRDHQLPYPPAPTDAPQGV